MLKVCDS